MIPRSVAVVALLGVVLVHLLDAQDKLHEAWLIGWLFIGLIAASLVVADLLARSDDVRAWFLAAALAASTMLGYCASRLFGLPTEHRSDVGNWAEPLGLASLLCEAVVLWACVTRLVRQPTAPRR